jgi:RHS repeat-associated protein
MSYTPVGGSATTEVRRHNPLNQITRTDSTRLAYDDNGNLTDDGTLLLEYDALNRLKRVKNASNSQTVGEYTYDAQGRRIRKVITNGGITGTLTNGTTDYLYDQNQCVEERDGSNSHTRQFIWGVYIDELIQQKTYATTGGGGLAAGEYYPLQDPHYRVMALTDDGGDVVEAYDYDPYGKRQVFSAAGTDAVWFTDDDTATDDAACEYGHQGLLHDEETGLVYNRARMLHPILGRFAQRDPEEYNDGMNLWEVYKSNPSVRSDTHGLSCGSGWNEPIVPDYPFEKVCVAHDNCYSTCGNAKDACDAQFLANMMVVCMQYSIKADCQLAAYAYYNAVKYRGQGPYDAAQHASGCGMCKCDKLHAKVHRRGQECYTQFVAQREICLRTFSGNGTPKELQQCIHQATREYENCQEGVRSFEEMVENLCD